MASHCSLRAGGRARFFFTPDDENSLKTFLKTNTRPLLFLGLGSNLLVRDGGFDGVVVQLKNLNQITLDKRTVSIGAGATLAKLARFCQANHLFGAEFLSAIPGTVGGALMMNAGAFGAEFWDLVVKVRTINTKGKVFVRERTDFKIGYRSVEFRRNDEYFIGASLTFTQTSPIENVAQLLKKRKQTQPIGSPNCGSVFKNPRDNFAAKLIESCDLKGHCIGGACVSKKHANFIINQHRASASDVENLIRHIQQTVKSKFNITLETEVKIV